MTRPAETIRQEMQYLRCEIADDMEDVVESARQMTDWRSYVTRYPLLFVGAAVVAGYMVMPKRVELISPDLDTLLEMARRNKLVVQSSPKAQAKSGVSRTLFSLIGGAVLRAGIALAGQHLQKVVSDVSRPAGE